MANVRWENHKALVCLVGEQIRRRPEIASQAFRAIADIDVRMICQGASERNISFLVDESRAVEAVQRLHRSFFSEPVPEPSIAAEFFPGHVPGRRGVVECGRERPARAGGVTVSSHLATAALGCPAEQRSAVCDPRKDCRATLAEQPRTAVSTKSVTVRSRTSGTLASTFPLDTQSTSTIINE